MNIPEILELHRLWLLGDPNGKRADLSDADLSDANLCCADLRYANLRYADLSDADLRYANLSDADLSDADLRYADLSGANLRYANLSDADLSGADLSDANLSDANLRYANLSGAVGNMREIKSLFFDTWSIVYTSDIMRIGCQQHTIEAWRTFTDDQIDAMDTRALTWWQTYKQAIFAIIDGARTA